MLVLLAIFPGVRRIIALPIYYVTDGVGVVVVVSSGDRDDYCDSGGGDAGH